MHRFSVLCLCVLLIAAIAGAPPAMASPTSQTPELLAIQTEIDKWCEVECEALHKAEADYRALHGVYWQGLLTHSEPVAYTEAAAAAETVELAAVALRDSKPSDQAENWSDFLPAWYEKQLPCSIRIDVYDGPNGIGYVITLLIDYKSSVWQHSFNIGPEEYRSSLGWLEQNAATE